MNGGEGGIRTHVEVAPQPAFEAGPLRPLRYLSVHSLSQGRRACYQNTGRGLQPHRTFVASGASPHQSPRRASAGLTVVARWAGNQLASSPAPSSTPATVARIPTSIGLTS